MENVTIFTHPLIQHKISILRKKETGTNEFRSLIEEIAMLMGYEALRDLPLEEVEVETPIETCMTPFLAGKKLAVVPILRAGLGMVNGILALVPSAKVGHIGLYRDEVTHEPHEYYCKLPSPIDQRIIVVTDPMLATGGSAVEAVDFIKQHGGKSIKFMAIIAAPEGLKRLHEAHPDIQIYVGHVDRCLNENGPTSALVWAMQATGFSERNRKLRPGRAVFTALPFFCHLSQSLVDGFFTDAASHAGQRVDIGFPSNDRSRIQHRAAAHLHLVSQHGAYLLSSGLNLSVLSVDFD